MTRNYVQGLFRMPIYDDMPNRTIEEELNAKEPKMTYDEHIECDKAIQGLWALVEKIKATCEQAHMAPFSHGITIDGVRIAAGLDECQYGDNDRH